MQHLNYSRQLRMQLLGRLRDWPEAYEPAQRDAALIAAEFAQKFQLPKDADILDDPDLRGLDPSMELRLPHRLVAIEFETSDERLPKAIVFALEEGDRISCMDWRYSPRDGAWLVQKKALDLPTRCMQEGFVQDGVIWGASMRDAMLARHLPCAPVLKLLNALACSNVSTERSECQPRPGRKVKSALPFDAYHFLTIDVGRTTSRQLAGHSGSRSPREHLRRGHIRRLHDGRRIWVNAAIVSAGKGGIVSKDYAIRRTGGNA